VWIGTVYTGNHFLIDIILGVALATVTYRLTDSSNVFYRTIKRWQRIVTRRIFPHKRKP